MVSILHLILGNNNTGNNSISSAQCELLLSLSGQRIDVQFEQKWTPIVGPMEHNIARFLSKGLLEEAPLESRFDARYRAADLKQILEERGIKAKGKKGEMIAALLASLPSENAEMLVADTRLYRPTPEGQRRLEAYVAQKEKDRKEMEAEALSMLAGGDARKAWSRISRYEAARVDPDPRWMRGIPEPLIEEATHLIKLKYDDLPLNEKQRRDIGAQLAMSVLLGESFKDAGQRLLSYTERLFEWKQVLAFHRPNPCGDEHELGQAELAEMYATTRIKEALAACELDSLKTVRLGKGIRILPVHSLDCSICNGGKYLYEWSEIDALPRLPRQMGCQCTYTAWL